MLSVMNTLDNKTYRFKLFSWSVNTAANQKTLNSRCQIMCIPVSYNYKNTKKFEYDRFCLLSINENSYYFIELFVEH